MQEGGCRWTVSPDSFDEAATLSITAQATTKTEASTTQVLPQLLRVIRQVPHFRDARDDEERGENHRCTQQSCRDGVKREFRIFRLISHNFLIDILTDESVELDVGLGTWPVDAG